MNKKKKWKPKLNEDYYFIGFSNYAFANSYGNDNSILDRNIINSDNCFRTLAEAEHKAQLINEILKQDYEQKTIHT